MSTSSAADHAITLVAEADLDELLPLMRAYCDFYSCAPSDRGLLEMCRTLVADPQLEGEQLIARDDGGAAVGFATVFWSWDTTEASRIGIMNDLYVVPDARGRGLADGLLEAALERCRARGASRMEWQTERGNLRAQAVYDRVGGVREPFVVYTRPTVEPA